MRKYLFLAPFIFGCQLAQPPKDAADLEGLSIIFVEDNQNVHGATALYENGLPKIRYNSAWLSSKPREFQEFIFYHEIGHFKKGHILPRKNYLSKTERADFQWEADCYSLSFLKNNLHYSLSQFSVIYDIVDIEFSRIRAEGLLRCLKKDSSTHD